MDNYLTFFPVGNGDMTLVQTSEDIKFLVDCNMKKSAEEETNNDFNCNEYLHKNLSQINKTTYIDALFFTHSDQDHCRGVEEYFNLCSPDKFDSEKIIISEIVVPARLLIDEELNNDDAKAIKKEAKRRLKLYGTDDGTLDGNRIQIIGYSDDLKDYSDVIVAAGSYIEKVNGKDLDKTSIFVLRPVKRDTDDDSKGINDATASFRLTFTEGDKEYVAILGGDLTCDNWKEVINYNPDLVFDILLAPHHCSWHAISNEDSKDGKADQDIVDFLEKSKDKAFVISSSKEIKRNEDNPPSYRAKNVYEKHLEENRFQCTANYPDLDNPKPYTLQITKQGVSVFSLESSKTDKGNNYSTYIPKSYGFGEHNE